MLFPFEPDYGTSISAGTPFAVPLPPEAQANPATFIAVRSRWTFDFAALRGGGGATWDYQNAWLLQATGGDPLAALLDIADRVTDGRPYEYGVAAYSRAGDLVARGPVLQPDVCLSCVHRGTAVATASALGPTNAVDCSNAALTNSFCGVNSGSVSITSAPPPQQVMYQPAPASASVYVPYFLPRGHGFRPRFERPAAPPPVRQRSQGVASPIVPRLVVPSGAEIRTFGRRP